MKPNLYISTCLEVPNVDRSATSIPHLNSTCAPILVAFQLDNSLLSDFSTKKLTNTPSVRYSNRRMSGGVRPDCLSCMASRQNYIYNISRRYRLSTTFLTTMSKFKYYIQRYTGPAHPLAANSSFYWIHLSSFQYQFMIFPCLRALA